MPFSQGYHDPETLALMTAALEAACLEMKLTMASEIGRAAAAAALKTAMNWDRVTQTEPTQSWAMRPCARSWPRGSSMRSKAVSAIPQRWRGWRWRPSKRTRRGRPKTTKRAVT